VNIKDSTKSNMKQAKETSGKIISFTSEAAKNIVETHITLAKMAAKAISDMFVVSLMHYVLKI